MEQHNMATAPKPQPNNLKKLLLPAILLILLVAFNIAQWFLRHNDNQAAAQQLGQKEMAYAELLASYKENKAIVDSLKTRFPGDTDLFAAFDRQLAEKEAAIRANIATTKDLESARQQIRQLGQMRDRFTLEITGLKEQVGSLTREKQAISGQRDRAISERDQLATTLEQSSAQLETEKNAGNNIALEREKLERERRELADKVEANAWLSISNLELQAVSVTKKGKEHKTKSRKAADRLKVCFSINSNGLVPAGEKQFQVQIMQPGGTPLFVSIKGSGEAKSKDDGSTFRFSTTATAQYDPSSGDNKACAVWEQPEGEGFEKGEYLVTVYHLGHRAGGGKIKLK